jgi:hypothetical protein
MQFVIRDLNHRFSLNLQRPPVSIGKKRIGRFEAFKMLKTCQLKTKQEQCNEIFYRLAAYC